VLNGNPALGKNCIESPVIIGQRVIFRGFDGNERKRKIVMYSLIPAVHHGYDIFRQNADKTLFEYGKIVCCSGSVVYR